MKTIGLALAGHAHRDSGHKKAKQYENPLTDLVNLVIAEAKAKQSIDRRQHEKTAHDIVVILGKYAPG